MKMMIDGEMDMRIACEHRDDSVDPSRLRATSLLRLGTILHPLLPGLMDYITTIWADQGRTEPNMAYEVGDIIHGRRYSAGTVEPCYKLDRIDACLRYHVSMR